MTADPAAGPEQRLGSPGVRVSWRHMLLLNPRAAGRNEPGPCGPGAGVYQPLMPRWCLPVFVVAGARY